MLFGLNKFQKSDHKITLISVKFSMSDYEKIKDTKQLKTTTQDLLHLMSYRKTTQCSRRSYCI